MAVAILETGSILIDKSSDGYTLIDHSMSPYTMRETDRIIRVNTASGVVVIQLVALPFGSIQILDAAFNFGTNKCTIMTPFGGSFPGSSTSVDIQITGMNPLFYSPDQTGLNWTVINATSVFGGIISGAGIGLNTNGFQPAVISLLSTGVTPGTYFGLTVDAYGRLTTATTTITNSIMLNNDGTINIGSDANKLAVLYSRNIAGETQTIAAASSLTLDPSLGEQIRITLSTTSIASLAINAGVDAQKITIHIIQDGGGSRIIPSTWANVIFAGGTYTATATSDKRDVLTLIYNTDDNNWYEICRSMSL